MKQFTQEQAERFLQFFDIDSDTDYKYTTLGALLKPEVIIGLPRASYERAYSRLPRERVATSAVERFLEIAERLFPLEYSDYEGRFSPYARGFRVTGTNLYIIQKESLRLGA